MEVYKELHPKSEGMKQLVTLLNKWWREENMTEEETRARVVLIFKEGGSDDLGNYRPISLLNSAYKIYTAIIKNRIEEKVEPLLHKTQYGFRKNRGTEDALQCIRRIVEQGEMTGNKTILLLLDWEKAFDKVYKTGLYKALERMGIGEKMLRVLRNVYNNPTFMVEIDGFKSDWKQQKTGIRQGCPLSPYLFIILMTVLFHDVHQIHAPNTAAGRITGALFDEVTYADDTICVSQSETEIEKALKAIREEGEKYGLTLNKAKCEILKFGPVRTIRFEEGAEIRSKDKVKYLGSI